MGLTKDIEWRATALEKSAVVLCVVPVFAIEDITMEN
jgi:hypothetical protein